MYVELVASTDTKGKRRGFAENYDGLLHVKRVVKASAVVPKKCSE